MGIPSHILFRSVDVQWAAAIRRVREKNRSIEEISVDMDTSRLRANKSLTSSARPSKRVRLEIPAVSTSVDVEARPEAEALILHFHRTPIPFSHIKDFTEMVENLERIEMPGQIAAVLQNPLLQHVVSCQHSRTTAARFSMWLQHALLEEFINSPDVTAVKQKEQLLHLVIKYSNFLQEGIPACERFLEKYLISWNGQDYKRHIFELIARYRMCPFSRLEETVLEPLRCLFFSSSVYFKCQVLVSLTSLLRNYCLVEWRRYLPQSEDENSLQEDGTSKRKYMSLFDEGVEEFLPRDTIQRLIEYVDRICCIALLVEADNILLMNYILCFYEQVCQLPKYSIPVICLPSRSVVYRMLLGVSAMPTSRICGLLCSYKTAFDQLKSSLQHLNVTAEETGLSQIDDLNLYITDFATSLWQYKAFQSSRPSAAFTFDPEVIQALDVPHPSACLSIHSHQSLLGFVAQFLQETQPEGSVVHPNSIKASQNTKQMYLKFLQRVHLHGIVQFVATFIRRKTRKDASREVSTMIMEEV
ncbi:centromere protein I-like [Liolophura sinensis]|uniref:centromere protein I-like n=1 Tax=Liolophura sinensis TaxID=3198878 RepID=UPI00315876CA